MLFYGKTTVIHLVRHPEGRRGKINFYHFRGIAIVYVIKY